MKNIFLLLICGLPLVSWGNTSTLSLTQIVSTARERAPVIRARLAESEVMKARTQQSSLLSNPTFMLQAGSLKTATQSGSIVDVTVLQPLPFPGKRQALYDLQAASARLTQLEGAEEILAMEHQAANMAIRLAVLDQLYLHTEERRKRFDLIRRSISSIPAASPVQKVERALVENQLRMLERGISLMESERRALNHELGLWLGSEDDFMIPVKWGEVSALEDLKTWEERAKQTSPWLKQADERKQMNAARLRTAELAAYPDFQVGVNYRKEQVRPANHFYHGMVGITIPIFDRGQHLASVAKAEMRVDEARRDVQIRTLSIELSRAWEVANTHRQLMRTFNFNLIKESERQFHAAELEFRKGRIDATTFLSTDAQIHESVDAAFQTTLDALTASNRLRQLAGLSPEF